MIEMFSGILAITTIVYAVLTYKILKANEHIVREMQRQLEALRRPYVSISPVLFPESPTFYLKIKNTGLTAAHNLRLTLDRDFFQFAENEPEKNLRRFEAFARPIDTFTPGAEMIFALAESFVVFGEGAQENLTPSIFKITADYEYANKLVSENTTIDLRPYLKSDYPRDAIVAQLKKISENLQKK